MDAALSGVGHCRDGPSSDQVAAVFWDESDPVRRAVRVSHVELYGVFMHMPQGLGHVGDKGRVWYCMSNVIGKKYI